MTIAMLEAIREPLGVVMPDSRTLPGVVNEDGEHAELRDRQMQEMAVAVSNRVADRLQVEFRTLREAADQLRGAAETGPRQEPPNCCSM
jgi:hypothetical protein